MGFHVFALTAGMSVGFAFVHEGVFFEGVFPAKVLRNFNINVRCKIE